MKKKLSKEDADQVVKILDGAIAEGPWDKSNFLRAIGKNLSSIRADFLNYLTSAETIAPLKQSVSKTVSPSEKGAQEVFVTLYSSEGDKLSSWERILSNLSRQVISRPVYAEEKDALFLIRSKENKANEAYVSVFIDTDDILTLSPDKTLIDKFGRPLLTLKDDAIALDKINRFVHLATQYVYEKGRLTVKPLAP